MDRLTLSAFIENGELWIYLDSELILRESDTISVELEDEQEYILHWFVKGVANSVYSITISSPKEAEYQLTKNIGIGRKDFGAIHFKI